MKTKPQNTLVLLFTLFGLCACGESRFGKPVERDVNGNLPPVVFAPVTDADALRTYEASTTLHERLHQYPQLLPLWNQMRRNLAGPEAEKVVKRTRIGRLLAMCARDRSITRAPLVQVWAIRYGQRLNGADGVRAERVMIDQVLPRTDLTNVLSYHTLAQWMSLPEPLTDAQREYQVNLDRFYEGNR